MDICVHQNIVKANLKQKKKKLPKDISSQNK